MNLNEIKPTQNAKPAAENTKKKYNNKKAEKYVPTFKKRLPTWKQIENESSELLQKYESVRI